MDLHETFNDSYARCNHDPNFLFLFYELFWNKDDKFRQQFANVDMQKQVKMLKASIAIILLASTSEGARESLRHFGKRHGPNGIGVDPLDFDVWFNSLLEAVEICDPYYNKEIEQAWRECFNLGLAIMKEECITQNSNPATS
ncbi:globin [uncultured Photobacterium sp.]|uniref:globin n=1 Tax=uncultured Photobacterium sp. TaxID=173973 RepID=UPI0026332529|nr:globin [uncultured Photobacterium sp.]